MMQDYKLLAQALARADVFVRASEYLVAMRRRQATHGGEAPTDLAAACKEAKLPGVPIDPFSGAPLKPAVVAGRPVVYSIWADGVDDHALKDSNLGRKPEGDMLFRLPAGDVSGGRPQGGGASPAGSTSTRSRPRDLAR
jgi:hypothetical protein